MSKNLRKRAKNKKGFTMVELIVVIVIILVLSAVLVPTILKYVDKAAQANTKADAATVLMQIQADVADGYATSGTEPTITIAGVDVTKGGGLGSSTDADGPTAVYITDSKGNVTQFSYQDKKHWIQWKVTDGWGEIK